MNKTLATVIIIFGFALVFAEIHSQEPDGLPDSIPPELIPQALRMPERGEAPRYPRDVVIGELGQGTAPEGAYIFAGNYLSNLIKTGGREELNSIGRVGYRIGGGRAEADGCVSFLVRFIGRDESITGELFLRPEDSPQTGEVRWALDELLLEEKRALSEIRDEYRFDLPAYERFF